MRSEYLENTLVFTPEACTGCARCVEVCPHRAELDRKTGPFFDLVGGDAGRAQLGQDQAAVADDIFEAGGLDALDQLLGAESTLAGGAPDVDAFRVQHQDIGVHPDQGAAQGVEAEAVIGGDEDGRLGAGSAQGVQPGLDAVFATAVADAGQEVIPAVGGGQAGAGGLDWGRWEDGGKLDHFNLIIICCVTSSSGAKWIMSMPQQSVIAFWFRR